MRTAARTVVVLLLAVLLGAVSIASAQTQPAAGELVTVDDVSQLFGGEWQATGGEGFGSGEVLGGGVEQPAATGCGIYEPDAGFFCMFTAAGVTDGGPTLTFWIDAVDPSADMTLWGWIQSTWGPIDTASDSASVAADAVPNVGDEAYLVTGTDLIGSTLAFRAGGVNVGAQFRSASDGLPGVTESVDTNARLAALGRNVAARLGQRSGATPLPDSTADAGEQPVLPDGSGSEQTGAAAGQLLTVQDVAQRSGGEWEGQCVHTGPPVGPRDTCAFEGRYLDAGAQFELNVTVPDAGETPETWRDRTGITGPNRAVAAGETTYVLWDDTAPVESPRLVFRSGRAVGDLEFALRGELFLLPGIDDLAMLAMERFEARLGDVTSVPTATQQPAPSVDPLDTAPLEPDETPLPDGQLVNGDDLTLHLGGTWDDPGTCGVNIPEGASYLCQFSSIDVGGDPQTLMVWVNRHGVGDDVSLESWRQTIEGRWREDSEAAPGAQTLEVISTVGEAAYLVTGTGDYAGSTLSFYDGAVDVRIQYAVDGPNGDPVSENQNLFLGDLARLVAERLHMQAAAATDDLGATAQSTGQPAPSATPVASAAPAPSVAPASPTPVPTVAPAPPTSPPVIGPVQVAGPGDISLDPVVITSSVVAAVAIVLLIPFPSALFNSTLEENYAEIRGWFRFRRRRTPTTVEDEPDPDGSGLEVDVPVAVQPEDGVAEAVDDDHPGDSIVATVITTETPASPIDRFWATRVGAISFFAVAGLLYGFLDPTFGLSLDSLLLYLGILAALAVGTLASTAAIRWARESLNGERGTFRVLPATLLVALVCVLVTRITDFQPGYLYGVLAGLAFGAVIGERAAGRESAIAISAVAGLGLAAFLALGVVRALEGSGGPTGLWVPLDVALSALVIGGFEGLLFGLVPLSGLPGATVKAWNSRIWALLLFLGALGFLHVIVNPSSGYLVDSSRTPLFKALALLVGFGVISVGLWAWFRYRPMDRLRERRAGAGTSAPDDTPPVE